MLGPPTRRWGAGNLVRAMLIWPPAGGDLCECHTAGAARRAGVVAASRTGWQARKAAATPPCSQAGNDPLPKGPEERSVGCAQVRCQAGLCGVHPRTSPLCFSSTACLAPSQAPARCRYPTHSLAPYLSLSVSFPPPTPVTTACLCSLPASKPLPPPPPCRRILLSPKKRKQRPKARLDHSTPPTPSVIRGGDITESSTLSAPRSHR